MASGVRPAYVYISLSIFNSSGSRFTNFSVFAKHIREQFFFLDISKTKIQIQIHITIFLKKKGISHDLEYIVRMLTNYSKGIHVTEHYILLPFDRASW